MLRDKKTFDLKKFEDNLSFYLKETNYYGLQRDAFLMEYTRGDSFEDMTQHFERLIELLLAYKEERLEREIEIFKFKYLEKDVYPLLAFAIALPVSEQTWHTLTQKILIPSGRDYITDRLIATRTPEREIASFESWDKTARAHQKFFKLLGEALEAPEGIQKKLIQKHLKNWHKKNWREGIVHGSEPNYPSKNHRYYGQFAYEVAAVVMAFNMDDSEFKEDIYYPKELVEYYRERTGIYPAEVSA